MSLIDDINRLAEMPLPTYRNGRGETKAEELTRLREERVAHALLRGYACACGILIRQHDQPTIARDLINAAFRNREEAVAAGVDEFDLEALDAADVWRTA